MQNLRLTEGVVGKSRFGLVIMFRVRVVILRGCLQIATKGVSCWVLFFCRSGFADDTFSGLSSNLNVRLGSSMAPTRKILARWANESVTGLMVHRTLNP